MISVGGVENEKAIGSLSHEQRRKIMDEVVKIKEDPSLENKEINMVFERK